MTEIKIADADLGRLLRALHGLEVTVRSGSAEARTVLSSLDPVALPPSEKAPDDALGECAGGAYQRVARALNPVATVPTIPAAQPPPPRQTAPEIKQVLTRVRRGRWEGQLTIPVHLTGSMLVKWSDVRPSIHARNYDEGIGPCAERIVLMRAETFFGSYKTVEELLLLYAREKIRPATVPELLAFMALYQPQPTIEYSSAVTVRRDAPAWERCVRLDFRYGRPTILFAESSQGDVFVNQTVVLGIPL